MTWRLRVRRLLAATLGVAAILVSGSLAAAHTLQAPAWRRLAALPAPAESMTAVRLPDNSVVVLGGDAAMRDRSRTALRFSLATGTWEQLPDAPVPLDTPAALVLGDRAILVVAPSFAHGSVASPSEALLFDPLAQRWLALPPCPVPLLLPRLLRLDTQTVLAAGGAGSVIGATLDLRTRRWTALPSPVPQLAGYTLAMVPGKGALLMAAVATDHSGTPVAVRRAFVLDSRSAWHEVARPPAVADGAHAVALSASRILFAGGYPLGDDPRLPAPPALLYDAASNRWSTVGDTGQDHRGAQLVSLGAGRAALVGGHRPDGWPSTGCLIFEGNRWQAAPSLPGPWANYGLVDLADGSLLLIGGDRPSGTSFAPVGDTMLLPLGVPQG